MAGPYPITAKLVAAFRTAIWQYSYLDKGEEEQPITYDDRSLSIGQIADRAARFDDKMPDDVISLLHRLAGRIERHDLLRPPSGYTFAAGGQCLRRMYDKTIARQRTRRRELENR